MYTFVNCLLKNIWLTLDICINKAYADQSGTKPNLVAKILATSFRDRLALATKIGSQH